MTQLDTSHALPQPSPLTRLRSVWTLIAVIPLIVLLLDPDNLGSVLRFAASAFLSTAPYILFAVLIIALLKATGAEALVGRAFTGRETRMILLAALVGGLAPFCSCEVIPFIAALLAVGTPLSVVMAFWLSSPLIDPPSLLITAAALGWPFAIGKAAAAVGVGVAGGLATMALARSGLFADALRNQPAKRCGCGPSPLDGRPVWTFWRDDTRRATFAEAAQDNLLFLAKWLAFAYLIEALMVHYVPASAVGAVVGGDGIGTVALAALVGMPAYLNGYAAPAIVAGFMQQGMGAGAAMAFLVAGAISSIPAMAAVWSLVRARVFAAYLGFGIVGAVIAGLAFQATGVAG